MISQVEDGTGRVGDWTDATWDTQGTARVRYAVVAAVGTGGSFLVDGLRRLGLGAPFPYLDAHRVPRMAARIGCWDVYGNFDALEYLRLLFKVRTSADGIFGIQVSPHQLWTHFSEDLSKAADFLGLFDKIVVLRRRDKLLQAIETVRHRREGDVDKPRRSSAPERQPFFGEIAGMLSACLAGDRVGSYLLQKLGTERVRVVVSEDLARSGTVADIGGWLAGEGDWRPHPLARQLEPIGPPVVTETDRDLKRRFLDHIGARLGE